MPDQLSQLRKLRLNGRGCAGAGASGIAAIIYSSNFTQLFFEGANVCDQRFDVSLGKFGAEWLHRLLAVRFYALLDCSFRFGIAERRLHFGVMLVLNSQFCADHGLSA